MRRSISPFFALFALTACATPPVKMTFGEAGLAPFAATATEPDEAFPPVTAPTPENAEPTGPPFDPILFRFAAEARDDRARLSPSNAFPQQRIAAWRDLADELESYLGRSLPQTPLAELVRARITVDAELDFDRRHFGAPPRELAELLADRIGRLGRRADAVRALSQTLFVSGPPPALQWPISDADLSSTFGLRMHPIDHVRRMHWGIDLAAPPGRVVSAAASGLVVHAGYRAGYGLVVEIHHAGDLTSRYCHLSRTLSSPGDRVEAGEAIGLVGATGLATGPHLHFEVWRGGYAQDPLAALNGRWPSVHP